MPRFIHNGADLYYELEGDGPHAVFIVGYSDHVNSVSAATLRQAFSQHFTVLMVDNRGAGQTKLPDDASVTIDMMADDIAALMAHHRMNSAHVLGVSMGGAIAMTLALNHPELVRSLVVAVSFAYMDSKRSEFILRSTRAMKDQGIPREMINRFTALTGLGESVFEDEALIEATINAPADPLEQTAVGAHQQMEAVRHYDIRERLNQITVPTLIMSSSEDVLVPPRYQQALAENIPGAEFKSYLGGHVFNILPAHSPAFVGDVVGFWQKHAANT